MNRNHLIHFLIQHNIVTTNKTLCKKYEKRLLANPELLQEVVNFTSFLRGDNNICVRLHVILDNIDTQPVCATCGSDVKMRLDGVYRFTFPTYCSSACFSNTESVKNKRVETSIKKYGVSNAGWSAESVIKRKQTNLERYGVENPAAAPQVKNKQRLTNLNRYGVENPTNTIPIKEKRKQTNLERYGAESVLSAPQVTEKRKQTNLERYGVESVFSSEEVQRRIKQINLERYGTTVPARNASIRAKITNTMKERYGVEHALQRQVPENALLRLNDAEWLKKQHQELEKNMGKIAEELGVSSSAVSSYLKRHQIEIMSRSTSQGERDIRDYIGEIYEGPIMINDRTAIAPQELDIYLPEVGLAFEYNGTFWHGELRGKDSKYHIAKLIKCRDSHIRLIQIMDSEWVLNQEIVKSRISSLLNRNQTFFARQTEIVTLSQLDAATFFTNSHIQGNANHSICYGLKLNNEVVAAMSLGKSRYAKEYQWELIRYANKKFTTIVGGASKLLTHFIRIHHPNTIVTYSDKRWNVGKLYQILGFTFSHSSKPNYRYFKPKDSFSLFSRQSFQKHKLATKLEIFDPKLTEWENMQNNGYDRIWDCGNDVYVYDSSIK